jgi:hypothetical protein
MNFFKKISMYLHFLVTMAVVGAWLLYAWQTAQWVNEENERLARTAPSARAHSNKLRPSESPRSQSIQGKVQADNSSKPH